MRAAEALARGCRLPGDKVTFALDALPSRKDEATRRLVALSQLLIRSRVPRGKPDWSELARGLESGLDGGSAPAADAAARPQRTQPLDTTRIEQRIVELQGDTFGVALSSTLGYEFECHPKARSALLLVEHERGKLLERIRDAAGPIALVTQYNPRERLSTLRYLVIGYALERGTQPAGDVADGGRLGVLVVRPSGEVVLAGTGVPRRSGKHFEEVTLAARETGTGPGKALAPTSIDGVITNDGFELDIRSAGQRAVRAGRSIGP